MAWLFNSLSITNLNGFPSFVMLKYRVGLKLKILNMIIVICGFREATVALNVWQPAIIRGREKQIVEQCNVSVDSRSRTLEMELKLCKQQIAIFQKTLVSFKREDIILLFDNNVTLICNTACTE